MRVWPRLMGAPFTENRQVFETLGLRVLHQVEIGRGCRAIIERAVLIGAAASDTNDPRGNPFRAAVLPTPHQFLYSCDVGSGQVERFEYPAMEAKEGADELILDVVVHERDGYDVAFVIASCRCSHRCGAIESEESPI